VAAQPKNPGDSNSRQPDFSFGRLDKNNDGYLSRKEAAADKDMAGMFTRADTNKDGRLSEDELVRARSAEDRKTAAQYAGDSGITAKVKAALLAEKGIPSTAITVETYKGVVQLSGFVESAEQVKKAGALAAKVGGVKSVKNTLGVK
jgi:hyperosmotically inducible protein